MITIRQANLNDRNFIVDLLVQHFLAINEIIGQKHYQTNPEKIGAVVAKRLANPGAFVYFIAEENGQAKGMASLLVEEEKRRGEILAILAVEENEAISEKLVDQSLNFFREKGLRQIITELASNEVFLEKIFQERGGRLLGKIFFLALKN